jgi:lysine decarboxylase
LKKYHDEQEQTPFFSKLVNYSKQYIAAFDVPGHKRGNIQTDLTKKLGKNIFLYDSNAPRGLDNLNHPTGVIKKSQELASKVFHADRAYFLTGGTTLGILAMVMATVKAKEKIILPRNVHKSVINSLILSGGIPIFVKPLVDKHLQIAISIKTKNIIKTIDDHPDAKAILLINPTYYGGTCDLQTIIEYAHQKGLVCLVDEAHGGNLYFHDQLPMTAMDAGADFSAVSIHKTNLSLTQSSVLLQKGERISPNRLQATINILQSTSPNQLFIASLDTSRKYMYFHAKEGIDNVLELSHKYSTLINEIPGISVKGRDYFQSIGCFDFDETKIIIDVSKLSVNGFDIYKKLADNHSVQLELAEEQILLCVLSIAQVEKDFLYLLNALKEMSASYYKMEEFNYPPIPLNYPKRCFRPRVAYHAPFVFVDVNDSLGEICAESIMIYPPGIPLIIPGEKIDASVINSINSYIKNDLTILSESEVGKIKVIDRANWKKPKVDNN